MPTREKNVFPLASWTDASFHHWLISLIEVTLLKIVIYKKWWIHYARKNLTTFFYKQCMSRNTPWLHRRLPEMFEFIILFLFIILLFLRYNVCVFWKTLKKEQWVTPSSKYRNQFLKQNIYLKINLPQIYKHSKKSQFY